MGGCSDKESTSTDCDESARRSEKNKNCKKLRREKRKFHIKQNSAIKNVIASERWS